MLQSLIPTLTAFIYALHYTMISKEHKMCVVLGDLIISLIKNDFPSTADFHNVLYSTFLYCLIHKPTRITRSVWILKLLQDYCCLIFLIIFLYFSSYMPKEICISNVKTLPMRKQNIVNSAKRI